MPIAHLHIPAVRVSQGAIVGNKLLAGALTEIKRKLEAQAQKHLSGRMTLRDKELLRRRVASP